MHRRRNLSGRDGEPLDGRFFDVAIVGAGPAGLAAASICASAGLLVAVLDGSGEERTHTRWESLHPAAVDTLQSLELEQAAAGAAVSTFSDVLREGRAQAFASGSEGVHVERPRFDRLLRAICRERGIYIAKHWIQQGRELDGVQILSGADGSVLRALCVLDASGRTRTLSRRWGWSARRLGPALIAETGLYSSETELTLPVFQILPDGWLWKTNDCSGFRNWTGVYLAQNSRPLVVCELAAKSLAGSHRRLRGTWTLSHPVASENRISVGDAAGSIDPATGQGIYLALLSGIRGAQTILQKHLGLVTSATAAAEYHAWFTTVLLRKANELSVHYEELGLFRLSSHQFQRQFSYCRS